MNIKSLAVVIIIGIVLLKGFDFYVSKNTEKDPALVEATQTTPIAESEKLDASQNQVIDTSIPTKNVVDYKELESYEKGGKIWKNITVPASASADEIEQMARDIHIKDPKSSYHIFDDDTKFKEFKDWDMNYGKVRDKDGKVKEISECLNVVYCRMLIQQEKYPYPAPRKWMEDHLVVNIQQMMDVNGGGMKWQLIPYFGEGINL